MVLIVLIVSGELPEKNPGRAAAQTRKGEK